MKFAALVLLLFSLAAAPLAPAGPPTPVAMAKCASACCQTEPDCCATACPCPPLSCQAPSAPAVIAPVAAAVLIFAPGSSHGAQLTDETCSERTYRPPVPPPRA